MQKLIPPADDVNAPSLDLVLRTPRLVLRPPQPMDLGVLRDHMRTSAAHLAPWTPRLGVDATGIGYLTKKIVFQRREWRRGAAYAFLVFLREGSSDVVGRVQLSQVTRGAFQNAYVGYAVDVRWVHRGIATEALSAVVAFAFRTLRLHRLQAAIMPSNARSLRVVEKVGFRREGLAQKYLAIGGKWEDHFLYALTEEEWPPNHPSESGGGDPVAPLG